MEELIELGRVRSSVSSLSSPFTVDDMPLEERTERGTACGERKARSSSAKFPVSSARDVPSMGLTPFRGSLAELIVKSTNQTRSESASAN